MIFRGLKPIKSMRVDIDPKMIRDEIWMKGLRVVWEQAAACPCRRIFSSAGRSAATSEPREGCIECQGSGLIYHSPNEVRAVVLGAETHDKIEQYGVNANGMVRITLLGEHLPSFQDRFTVLDYFMVYREVRQRVGTVDAVRAPIVRHTVQVGTEADPTVPENLDVAVLYCRRSGEDGVLMPGELSDGTDFEVTVDGKLDWTKGDALGTAPPVGGWFAASYFTNPRYVVESIPHVTRVTRVAAKAPEPLLTMLPVQVDARLDFYFSGRA